MLLDDDDPDTVEGSTWQSHGPFQIWTAKQGIGVVYVGDENYAFVRFTDGVVFHEGPDANGALMGWVERILRDGKRSVWDVLKDPDPEDSVAPVVPAPTQGSEGPLARDEPVQRGPHLKTLRLPDDTD